MISKLNEIEAFILIGGSSRRFGKPKCITELKGKRMAEIVYSNITDSFKNVSIVGKKNHFPQYNFIPDKHKIQCPMNGIETALAAAKSDWIFVIACDMPRIDSIIIDHLYDKIDFSKNALIPKMDNKLQPLCGFYNRSIANAIKTAINNHEYTLFKILKKSDITEVSISLDVSNYFLNINYLTDLEKIR